MAVIRNGSVLLDSIKVIAHASQLGISSKNAFQDHYNNIYEGTGRGADGAPVKAWEGTRMRRAFAQTIAELFGLSNYIPLLESQGSTAWSNLIHNEQFQSSFMKFCIESGSNLGMIDFQGHLPHSRNKVDKINTNERWHLKISGKSGQFVMVLLQSQTEFFQVAPLSIEGFDNMIPKGGKELRYPMQGSLSFQEESGLGWRRFIVVKSYNIPFPPKSFDVGFNVLPIELDTFAQRLLQNEKEAFEVDQYEFQIVDTKTICF